MQILRAKPQMPDDYAQKLLLPSEDPAAYQELLDDLMQTYRPQTALQRIYVREAIRTLWMLQRHNRRYDDLEHTLSKEQPDESKWTHEQWRWLDRRARACTMAQRSSRFALRTLEQMHKKAEQKVQPQPKTTQPETTKQDKSRAALDLPKLGPRMLYQHIKVMTESNGTAPV